MTIEVIGPPAAGKSTFLESLAPSIMTISEPLHELKRTNRLPAPGWSRQRVVIDHVMARLPTPGHRALVDSGVLYLLAFAGLKFVADPHAAELFDRAADSARSRDLQFSGVVRLTAPPDVLEKRRSADQARARNHFHENVQDYEIISQRVDDLARQLDPGFLFTVNDTNDPGQMRAAREWVLSRSSQRRLEDVIVAAKLRWLGLPSPNSAGKGALIDDTRD